MPAPVAYASFAMPAFQSSSAPPPPSPAVTDATPSHPEARPEAAETPAPPAAAIATSARRYDDLADLPKDLQAWLDEQERAVLIRALKAVNYNRTAAANLLGLNLRQMRYRIERLNIPTEPDARE
ncbi:hypothetical protein EII18_05255 [Comamonadaceae bacterium OH3737_COT-264]|nr:hypothetical protein EII18_05255 [Comamonadaceae bacterium OH3737_COT-264]